MNTLLSSIAFFSLIAFTQNIYAQESDSNTKNFLEKRGDNQVENFAYARAIKYYSEALKDDPQNAGLQLKMARAYIKINDTQNAEKWFNSLENAKSYSFSTDVCLEYAKVLTDNNKPDKASIWYEKYKSLSDEESITDMRLENLGQLSSFYQDSAQYRIRRLSVNSSESDFSPTWYNEGVVFVSNRSRSPFAKSNFLWDDSNYLDLYYGEMAEGGDLVNAVPFHDDMNSKYHEGPLSFFDDGRQVVFTRNSYYRRRSQKSDDGVTNLDMYFATLDGDRWSGKDPFPYNTPEYSLGHPTITNDGTTLYFVSNMPGGFGGTDLYVSYFSNGAWAQPTNLGDVINSSGNEMFPYLSGSTLYFSSDGHPGLGGLDVYSVELIEGEPLEVVNLGFPISTNSDDFSFIIDASGEHGYFSSNRAGNTSDDIYYFSHEAPKSMTIAGVVEDNHTGSLVPGAKVHLISLKGDTIQTVEAGPGATFSLTAMAAQGYYIAAEKKGYMLIQQLVISPDTKESMESLVVKLEPPHHLISMNVKDQETLEIVPNAILRVIDNSNSALMEVSLRDSIHYEFGTRPNQSYTILGSKEGYFNSTMEIAITEEHEFDTLFFEVAIRKFEIGKAIRIDNIYYDNNKAEIRKDAEVELDKLVKILKDNPSIKIELSSHTDSKGSDEYNLNLSQRRAESATAHVVSKGIDQSRIQAKGYGETQLVNECENGVNCDAGKHQQNRRTEFKVIE